MDTDLRELERQAASGDERAEQRLRAVRRRIGIRTVREGRKMITDLVGARVKYLRKNIFRNNGTSTEDPFYEKEGVVTAAYVPDITGKGDSAYSESSRIRLVVDIEGQLVDRVVEIFGLIR